MRRNSIFIYCAAGFLVFIALFGFACKSDKETDKENETEIEVVEEEAEDDDIWRPYEGEYRWYGVEPLVDFDNEWHPNFVGILYSEPSKESEIIYKGYLPRVYIKNALSVIEDTPSDYPYWRPSIRYFSWYYIDSMSIRGWAERTSLFEQSAQIPGVPIEIHKYRAVFERDFYPLREKPEHNAPPITYIGDEIDGFVTTPKLEKGKATRVFGRYNDWLLVSFDIWDEGWIKYDDTTFTLYRLIYYAELPFLDMSSDIRIFIPVEDSFGRVLIETYGYLDEGRLWLEDSEIVLSTSSTDVTCNGAFLSFGAGLGSAYSRSSYYLFTLPGKVNRKDITHITFNSGVPEFSEYENKLIITIDSQEVWGEFEK